MTPYQLTVSNWVGWFASLCCIQESAGPFMYLALCWRRHYCGVSAGHSTLAIGWLPLVVYMLQYMTTNFHCRYFYKISSLFVILNCIEFTYLTWWCLLGWTTFFSGLYFLIKICIFSLFQPFLRENWLGQWCLRASSPATPRDKTTRKIRWAGYFLIHHYYKCDKFVRN